MGAPSEASQRHACGWNNSYDKLVVLMIHGGYIYTQHRPIDRPMETKFAWLVFDWSLSWISAVWNMCMPIYHTCPPSSYLSLAAKFCPSCISIHLSSASTWTCGVPLHQLITRIAFIHSIWLLWFFQVIDVTSIFVNSAILEQKLFLFITNVLLCWSYIFFWTPN